MFVHCSLRRSLCFLWCVYNLLFFLYLLDEPITPTHGYLPPSILDRPPVYRNTLDCLRLDIVVTYHHVQTTTLFFLFSPSFLCHCRLLFSGVVFLLKTFICNIVVAPQIPAHSRSFHSSLRTLPPPRTTLGEMDAISILGISTYMDDFLWIFLVELHLIFFFGILYHLDFCCVSVLRIAKSNCQTFVSLSLSPILFFCQPSFLLVCLLVVSFFCGTLIITSSSPACSSYPCSSPVSWCFLLCKFFLLTLCFLFE